MSIRDVFSGIERVGCREMGCGISRGFLLLWRNIGYSNADGFRFDWPEIFHTPL